MSNSQYHHLQTYFGDLIRQKKLEENAKLPSEREIGEQFKLTRITVRQALQNLEAEGMIYRQNRRGWFVTPPPVIYDPANYLSFNLYVTEQGFVPHTETLLQQIEPANEELAQIMGIEKNTPVLFLHRRRYINQRPVLIEKIYINFNFFPGIEKEDLSQSLGQLLKQKYQLVYRDMDLSFKSTSLPAHAANDLGISAGHAGLHLERINYTSDKKVLEVDYEFWRHDAMSIKIELRE